MGPPLGESVWSLCGVLVDLTRGMKHGKAGIGRKARKCKDNNGETSEISSGFASNH